MSDPRDEFSLAVFETYYNAYFQELLHESLVGRWQRFDEINKVLVALTASGSAISGWAVWSKPGPKLLWAALAGTAAILAVIGMSLDVPRRLRDWGEIESQFSALRVTLETFRYKMRFDPQFPFAPFVAAFEKHREQYSKLVQLRKPDILITARLVRKTKRQLDLILIAEDEIEA